MIPYFNGESYCSFCYETLGYRQYACLTDLTMQLLITLLLIAYKLLAPAAEDYLQTTDFLGTEPVLLIPSLNVSSPITTFYQDGLSWTIDPWEKQVGHLENTAWINESSNVVLAGHSQYPNGKAGIFFALDKMQVGDMIFIRDGIHILRFKVTEVRSVDYRDLTVLYPSTDSRLTLITCSIPSYVAKQNLYFERVVVIAEEIK